MCGKSETSIGWNVLRIKIWGAFGRKNNKESTCPCTRRRCARWAMMIARDSPPQTPPPSHSYPRHGLFGPFARAKDGGESGVGAGWNSSSHCGIQSGELINPPLYPPSPGTNTSGRAKGKGVEGGLGTSVFPALSPTALPRFPISLLARIGFPGRGRGGGGQVQGIM